MSQKSPYLFISYRRDDSLATARALLRFLHSQYGRQRVFMDTVEIRSGNDWQGEIRAALEKSTVVLPIIGSRWFTLTDTYGRRRIDQEDDWVGREIEMALASGKVVIPIYIGIPAAPPEAFPHSIQQLADRQGRVISGAHDDSEWIKLGETLERHGFGPLRPNTRYPRPAAHIRPCTDQQIESVLQQLNGWRAVASPVPNQEHIIRNELHKSFEFGSFEKAMKFMMNVSVEVARVQHHPRWENIWRTVDVWLSTWDVQFQISDLDVQVARLMEEEARKLRSE
jgi:pterin-4a-carbinolamine dehydratase